MNIIYNKISLDTHNIASQLTLAVKKGDTARGLIITLTENGKIHNIPEHCYATFSAKKSDGTHVSSGCVIKDNKIVYDFSPQLTTMPGRVDCELTLFSKDDSKITSPLFTLYVYRTIKDEYEEEIASSDEFKTLDRLISETTEVIAEAESTIETANTTIAKAEEAISAANESVTFIERTEDGKLKLLNFDREEIATVDVFCGDDNTLYRYNDGRLSVVGIKECNEDETYRIWVGTNAEYVALPEKDPKTIYYITDETLIDDILSGVIKVGYAEKTDKLQHYIINSYEDFTKVQESLRNYGAACTVSINMSDLVIEDVTIPRGAQGIFLCSENHAVHLILFYGTNDPIVAHYSEYYSKWYIRTKHKEADHADHATSMSTLYVSNIDELTKLVQDYQERTFSLIFTNRLEFRNKDGLLIWVAKSPDTGVYTIANGTATLTHIGFGGVENAVLYRNGEWESVITGESEYSNYASYAEKASYDENNNKINETYGNFAGEWKTGNLTSTGVYLFDVGYSFYLSSDIRQHSTVLVYFDEKIVLLALGDELNTFDGTWVYLSATLKVFANGSQQVYITEDHKDGTRERAEAYAAQIKWKKIWEGQ